MMLKKRFDSDYECNRPLPAEKNEKVIVLIKDKLKEKIMTKFALLEKKFILT